MQAALSNDISSSQGELNQKLTCVKFNIFIKFIFQMRLAVEEGIVRDRAGLLLDDTRRRRKQENEQKKIEQMKQHQKIEEDTKKHYKKVINHCHQFDYLELTTWS